VEVFTSNRVNSGEKVRQRQHHCDILPVLLSGCERGDRVRQSALGAIWAEEAMHRGYALVKLSSHFLARPQTSLAWPYAHMIEMALARDLAEQYKTLSSSCDADHLPCKQIVNDVLHGIVALFGYRSGVTVETDLQEVSLTGRTRSALAFAASELVTNAVLHAFPHQMGGHIIVTMHYFGSTHAILRVKDDGIGFTNGMPDRRAGIVAGLAVILNGDLRYGRVNGWTSTELEFPTTDIKEISEMYMTECKLPASAPLPDDRAFPVWTAGSRRTSRADIGA
jgi:hypothetical protein